MYDAEPDKEEERELFAEEEIADDLHDAPTARLLRTIGDGYDDTELLRSDLQNTIDTIVNGVYSNDIRCFTDPILVKKCQNEQSVETCD